MQKQQMPNGQFQQGQRPSSQMGGSNSSRQFMQHLTNFMQQRGLPLETSPFIGDRQIAIIMLYSAVIKFGGYKKVNALNQWPQIASALQINPLQNAQAPAQLKTAYERNLSMFEEAYAQMQARQKAQMMQSQGGNMQSGQQSPTKGMNIGTPMQNQPFMGQPQNTQTPQQSMPPQTPMKQMNQAPAMNGYQTPQMHSQPSGQTHTRNNPSLTRPMDNSMPGEFPAQMQTPGSKAGLVGPTSQTTTAPANLQPYELPKEYIPCSRAPDSYGGVSGLDQAPDALYVLAAESASLKPNVPQLPELGLVDIHALTMSLQSGIRREVRLALDNLGTLSIEQRLQIDLKACEDLVESLVDCAEEQVELLAENAAEVSDVMLISSYEDVVRGCRVERDDLQDCPEFGSLEYELDRAVDKLIAITTIIRNFSFIEANHPPLAEDNVVKFLCTVIRYLGTRNMLLRNNANTLEFMKDVIIFLSNLAQTIEIPGKEQALCLLHFLLAFAPTPPPYNASSDAINFSPYDPAIHRYLPPAVDSLAKLLARDEPNRTFYKTIFASDVSSQPPYDLLTKAFALAISPIPGHKRDEQRINILQVVDSRKPHLMQGMLAAEILSNLVSGAESGLARAWLSSEDGFAQNLLHLVTVLSSAQPVQHQQRGPLPSGRNADDDALLHITLSGVTVLRRLWEKARSEGVSDDQTSLHGMIKQENLLGALLLKPPAQPRPEVIKQLLAFAALAR